MFLRDTSDFSSKAPLLTISQKHNKLLKNKVQYLFRSDLSYILWLLFANEAVCGGRAGQGGHSFFSVSGRKNQKKYDKLEKYVFHLLYHYEVDDTGGASSGTTRGHQFLLMLVMIMIICFLLLILTSSLECKYKTKACLP